MTNDFQEPDGIHQRFSLGDTLIHRKAVRVLSRDTVFSSLKRHAAGDWGDVTEKERAANERALLSGRRRLLSVYHQDKLKFWIITEANRRKTKVLLADDY